MLWNSVFEFFIKYVFGGVIEENGNYVTYSANLGRIFNTSSGSFNSGTTADLISNYKFGLNGQYVFSFGNYLSLIATIITMVIIVTLCSLFIWKIVKLVGGLIR